MIIIVICPDCKKTNTTVFFEETISTKFYLVDNNCNKTKKTVSFKKYSKPLIRTGYQCIKCGYTEYNE